MLTIFALTRPLLAAETASTGLEATDGTATVAVTTRSPAPASPSSAPTGSPMSTQRLQHGPYAVGSFDITLVDPTRPTSPNGRYKGSSSRTLKTTVWYPARRRPLEALRFSKKPVARDGGPFPLVIYSHGFMSFRSEGSYLARHLASRGYVVVAATYPLTNYFAPGKPTIMDVIHQPGDVRFLIDSLLGWSADSSHRLSGAIDPERIAAVGLSLGGMTTALATFHPKLRDPRITAAVSIAGPSSMFGPLFYQSARIPYMVVAGDIDAIVSYESNASIVRHRAPHATLVTLRSASHTSFSHQARWLFRFHANADVVGCRQLQKNLKVSYDLTLLGGATEGITDPDYALPCGVPKLPRALRPARQHALTTLAVSSFLDAHLARDAARREEGSSFLWQVLPAENPEVEVWRQVPSAAR